MDFWSLQGLTPYETARQLQLRLVELRSEDRIPDTVLFLEHEPVVTRGRGLQFTGAAKPRHIPMPAPLPPGVDFSDSERGGDLTYHGPGQLVIYPVFKLNGEGFAPHHDVTGFLRRFEQVFIDVIGQLCAGKAQGFAREGATGVWISRAGEAGSSARKVASMGIAVRKWVTYHGLAINAVNDLGPFHLISPCGFAPEVMTRLSDWLEPGSSIAARFSEWELEGRRFLEQAIADRMQGEASHILNLDRSSPLVTGGRAEAAPVGQP